MWQISVIFLSLALVILAMVTWYLHRKLIKIAAVCRSFGHLEDIDGYV